MITDKDKVYLEHILECITKIKQYTKRGHQYFVEDDLIQDAVLRRIDLERTWDIIENYLSDFERVIIAKLELFW